MCLPTPKASSESTKSFLFLMTDDANSFPADWTSVDTYHKLFNEMSQAKLSVLTQLDV